MDISCGPLRTPADFNAFDNLLLYCQQQGLSIITRRTPDKMIVTIADDGNIQAFDKLKSYLEHRYNDYQTSQGS